jgi:predicted nucleic acid-binding protein
VVRYVLDTNVISEILRAEPDTAVLDFVRSHDFEIGLTAMSRAELGHGVERLPTGARQTSLRRAVDELLTQYEPDTVPFDAEAARHYGRIAARLERAGTPRPMADLVIAASCAAIGATLVTRNVKDFAGTGIEVLDPWTT